MGIKRTLTDRKFIKEYLNNGGNATEAYMSLHPDCSRRSAGELGYRMLKKVEITVTEFLNKAGVNDIVLSEKLKEGLDADKVISVIPIAPKEANPSTGDLHDAGSKDIDFVNVPDYQVRHKYLDMAYKLKDKYPADRHKIELPKDLKIKVKLVE